MKTRVAILIALSCTVASFGVYAQDVPAPTPSLPGAPPKLFPSEQGAFKILEVASQVVEAAIVQKGCEPATYPIEVHTTKSGTGSAVLGTAPGAVNLNVTFAQALSNNGRRYFAQGAGSLNGLSYANIFALGSFNIGAAMQELSTQMQVSSTVTGVFDTFSGTVIKDYWRYTALQPIPPGFDDSGIPVSTVVDYGYQQISKKNFIKAKYWQQSRTWRDDGVNAGTYWLKTRVAPTGETCAIEIRLQGYGESPTDNVEGFNEKGTLSVLSVPPGPFVVGG